MYMMLLSLLKPDLLIAVSSSHPSQIIVSYADDIEFVAVVTLNSNYLF